MVLGKSFYMLFDCLDGGVVEPIELNKSQIADDRSLILMDEDNQTVWLWHGKLRGLVQRRTSLRQAQSLKGHGYKAGNAIIGRDLHILSEIDARKVDRVPEDTELNNKFVEILDKKYSNIGNFVYVQGSKESSSGPNPTAVAPEKRPSPQAVNRDPAPTKTLEKKVKDEPEKVTPKPAVTSNASANSNEIKQGAFIMAVMAVYKDIWLSKKADGKVSIEQMDGKICTFSIANDKVEYDQGSFGEVPSDKRSAIEEKYNQIIKE